MAKARLTWAKDKRKLGKNGDLREEYKPKINIIKQSKKHNRKAGKVFIRKVSVFRYDYR